MGGEGERRLNSIYSSVVFREEREIEFTGRCSGQARRPVSQGGLGARWERRRPGASTLRQSWPWGPRRETEGGRGAPGVASPRQVLVGSSGPGPLWGRGGACVLSHRHTGKEKAGCPEATAGVAPALTPLGARLCCSLHRCPSLLWACCPCGVLC